MINIAIKVDVSVTKNRVLEKKIKKNKTINIRKSFMLFIVTPMMSGFICSICNLIFSLAFRDFDLTFNSDLDDPGL